MTEGMARELLCTPTLPSDRTGRVAELLAAGLVRRVDYLDRGEPAFRIERTPAGEAAVQRMLGAVP